MGICPLCSIGRSSGGGGRREEKGARVNHLHTIYNSTTTGTTILTTTTTTTTATTPFHYLMRCSNLNLARKPSRGLLDNNTAEPPHLGMGKWTSQIKINSYQIQSQFKIDLSEMGVGGEDTRVGKIIATTGG